MEPLTSGFTLIVMPLYYFDTFHDPRILISWEEYVDQHATWEEATTTAGQILQTLSRSLSLATIGGWSCRTNFETRFTS
jgi:hypothetical protein